MLSNSTWKRSSRLLRSRVINQLREEDSDSVSISDSIPNPVNNDDVDFNVEQIESSNYEGSLNSLFSSNSLSAKDLSEKLMCELLVDHHASKAQLSAVITMINKLMTILDCDFRIQSINQFWREATKIIQMEYFFLCDKYHVHGPYIGVPRKFKNYNCDNESIKPKLETGNYLIRISLRQQLEKLLPNVSQSLTNHDESTSMNSITDASLAKECRITDSCFTLTMFCDEVPVSKSSRLDVLPFYVIINELETRVREKNALLIGLYAGKSKPSNPNSLLKPLISEFKYLEMNSLTWRCAFTNQEFTKRFKLICCIADAPMRAYLRSVKQFSSRYGCDWCKIEGVYESNAMKFPHKTRDELRELLRTKHDFLMYAQGYKNDIPTVESIKRNSELLTLHSFDIVWGFSVDLMHSVFLGVVKDFFRRGWLNPDMRDKSFSLRSRDKLERIERRIQCMKVTSNHLRPLRSLEEYKDWKANEFASFLLYFAFPILDGILPNIFLAHFCQLAEAISILCTEIKNEESLLRAEIQLASFSKNVQLLYGFEFCTYNVHLLSHLVNSVRKLGPLIPSSAFLSENEMGKIKRANRKFSDIPQALANLHLISFRAKCEFKNEAVIRNISMGSKSEKSIPDSLKIFYRDYVPDKDFRNLISMNSIRINNVLLTIDDYDKKFKRCNSVIYQNNSAYKVINIYYDRFDQVVVLNVKSLNQGFSNEIRLSSNRGDTLIESILPHIVCFQENLNSEYIIMSQDFKKLFVYVSPNGNQRLLIKPIIKLI